MKREMLTMDELEAKLREEGVESLSDVRMARLLSNGKLSVFTKSGSANPQPDNATGGPLGH